MKDLTFKKYQKLDGYGKVVVDFGLDLLDYGLSRYETELVNTRMKMNLLRKVFTMEPNEVNFEALKAHCLMAEKVLEEMEAQKKEAELEKAKSQLKEIDLKGKTTKELNGEQLSELKWKLFSMDEGHEYAYVDEIFDDVIHRKYEGKRFHDEDFVSNNPASESKELAIKLHIYKKVETNIEEGIVGDGSVVSETFPEVYNELVRILEENGFEYQIYEGEVNDL